MFGWAQSMKAAPSAMTAVDEDSMLRYFLSTLEVRATRLEAWVANDQVKLAIVKQVRESLTKFPEKCREASASASASDFAWNEGYRLERLLALAQPQEDLTSEVQRRIDEAVDEKVSSAARLASRFDALKPLALDTSNIPPKLRPEGEVLLRSLLLLD